MSKLAKALTAAAGNAGESLYVEDVFSTFLYEGDSSTGQDITNGIDLSGEGGMVWFKTRSSANAHNIYDTVRGNGKMLYANTAEAEYTNSTNPWTPSSTGFNTGDDFGGSENQNGEDTVAWTFRKAEKFFDVVTYTGTGSNQAISHALGSVPGCIIVRALSGDNWYVWHNSLSTSGAGSSTGHKRLILNSTAAEESRNGINTITSSSFDVLGSDGETGGNGTSYVAYLFASDAGGFGDDGTENIIKCGSYVGDGTSQEIDLGWEAQFVIAKRISTAGIWYAADSMRGEVTLAPNSANAEDNNPEIEYTARGFKPKSNLDTLHTYIYIAIRRPMKTPESGTEVFAIDTLGGTSPNPPGFNGVLVDWAWKRVRNTTDDWYSQSRLTGTSELKLNTTDTESTADTSIKFDYQDGWLDSSGTLSTQLSWMFKRATGFMDVVAYTGDGTAGSTQAHNLGVVPEFMVIKQRSGTNNWICGGTILGTDGYMFLNNTNARDTQPAYWNNTLPTATQFTVGNATAVNETSQTYISYLFATVAGVSKVGSYTGTGSNVDVDCGFSAGARFILIKRYDSTGDWYTWNYFRGITAGNDPYLLLNTTAAEVTNTDYVDPLSSGFTVTSSAPAALNASGGTYIFLAIA